MDEVNKWYQNATLDTIKSIIKDNISAASRSFVTIGYYLKDVRTRELYRQDGYKDIWEFAQSEFGLSQSTASRFMSINDKFSVDGNSPILLEEYRNFGSGKLQEMINMSDEQISQITEDTTVAEIKQIKKESHATSHKEKSIDDLDKIGPSLKPEVDDQLEGQTSIQEDFPNLLPKQIIPVFEEDGEAYGWTWNQVIAALMQEMQKDEMTIDELKDGTDECFQCLGKTYVACGFNSEYITIQNDNCESLFKISLERFQEEYDWHLASNKVSSEDSEEKKYKLCKFGEGQCNLFTDPMKCSSQNRCKSNFITNKVNNRFEPKEEELSETGCKKTVRPEDSLITTPGCGNGKYDCFSCYRDCDIRQEQCYCVEAPLGNPFFCTTMNVIQNLSADVGDKCMFINHDLAHNRAGNHEPVPCCKECTERCGYACGRAAHEDIKVDCFNQEEGWHEEIIVNNPEIKDDAPKPQFTAMQHLKDAIKREQDQLDQMRDSWSKNNPDALLKHETILLALKLHLTDLEYPEPALKIIHKYNVDPYKEKDTFNMVLNCINAAWDFFDKKDYDNADFYLFQARKDLWEKYEYDRKHEWKPEYNEGILKQPDLPILKNNDQRKEWIDKFETWPVWIDQEETGEKYYRYDLTDKVAIVVKVSKKHAYDHKRYKELKDYEYSAEQYYLLGVKYTYGLKGSEFKEDDTRTFYECNTNKTTIVDYLKVFQRK